MRSDLQFVAKLFIPLVVSATFSAFFTDKPLGIPHWVQLLAIAGIQYLLVWSHARSASSSSERVLSHGRDGDLETLSTTLTAKITIIPVLTTQLSEVIQQTEATALDLNTRFMSIAERANQQAATASRSLAAFTGATSASSTEAEASNSALLEVSRKSFTQVLEKIRNTTDHTRKTLEQMGSIVEDMKKVGGVVEEIQSISNQTNLLALNAAIEAAHAGEEGAGFAVVADEVKRLSSRTKVSATSMSGMIQKIGSDVQSVHSESRKRIIETDELAQHSEAIVNDVLARIDQANRSADLQLNTLTKESEALAKDVNAIIMSMQFSDITRQRLEHVIEPLQTLKEDLHTALISVHAGEPMHLAHSELDIEKLEQSYTMESERKVLRLARQDSGSQNQAKDRRAIGGMNG